MPDAVCSVAGCDGSVKARGWCSGHYSRWQRNGDIDIETPLRREMATLSECPKAYHSGCRCAGCLEVYRIYQRRWRSENLETVQAGPVPDGKHGTGSGYSYYGCRCDACREWKRLDPATRTARGRYRARLAEARHDPYDIVELHKRDSGRCGICGTKVDINLAFPHPKSPSVDHILPLSEGGDDVPANVQVAHFICNSRKGAGGSDQLRLVG